MFYVGINLYDDLMIICCFLLKDLLWLLIVGEYIYWVVYDIGVEYGKDIFMFIEKFGIVKVFVVFVMKDKVDVYLEKFGMKGLLDKVL